MKRGFFLGMLLSVGALSLSVAAFQQQQQAPKVVEVEKLKDNLYMPAA